MMHVRCVTYLVGILLVCTACGSDEDPDVDPGVTYDAFGQPFEPAPALPVESVLAEAGRYEGRAVMVEGILQADCETQGCWMAMRTDTSHLVILRPAFDVAGGLDGRRAVVHGRFSSADAGYTLEPTGVMVESYDLDESPENAGIQNGADLEAGAKQASRVHRHTLNS